MRRRLVGALAAVSLFSGCMPMAYVRPDATSAQLEIDKRECGELAREAAFHAPYFWWWRQPPYPYWAHRHRNDHPFFWRVTYEHDLYDFCLRARGYRLAPLE